MLHPPVPERQIKCIATRLHPLYNSFSRIRSILLFLAISIHGKYMYIPIHKNGNMSKTYIITHIYAGGKIHIIRCICRNLDILSRLNRARIHLQNAITIMTCIYNYSSDKLPIWKLRIRSLRALIR